MLIKSFKGVQPIAFENASWAYTLGVGVALKKTALKLLMLLTISALACRLSAFPALLLSTAQLVRVTATWAPCC